MSIDLASCCCFCWHGHLYIAIIRNGLYERYWCTCSIPFIFYTHFLEITSLRSKPRLHDVVFSGYSNIFTFCSFSLSFSIYLPSTFFTLQIIPVSLCKRTNIILSLCVLFDIIFGINKFENKLWRHLQAQINDITKEEPSKKESQIGWFECSFELKWCGFFSAFCSSKCKMGWNEDEQQEIGARHEQMFMFQLTVNLFNMNVTIKNERTQMITSVK